MEPLYIPTRAECDEAKAQMRQILVEAGVSSRWDLDNIGCSCGGHADD